MHRGFAGIVVVALSVLACGGGGDGPGTTTPARPVVSRVVVTSDKPAIVVGASATFTATAQDAAGATITGRGVTWLSSNISIAQINSGGVAAGIGGGTTTISAVVDGVTGTAPLTVVLASVASVEVQGLSSIPLFSGQTAQLSALLKDSLGNPLVGRSVTWSSSNETVATITTTGVVSAIAVGTATISAASGKTGTALLTVALRSVASVAITPTPMRVAIGGTATLVATARDQQAGTLGGISFTYSSSDASIAPVSATGVVTGIRTGAVTLTASALGVPGTTPVSVIVGTPVLGRVYPADGGAVTGLAFTVQTGSGASLQNFAGAVDAAGFFRVDAPLLNNTPDSVDLIVDVASGPRTYRPVAARVSVPRATIAAARPILIPRSVAFSSPTYGNTSAVVSLEQAFTRVCSDNTNANCNSYFPQVWRTAVPLWSEAELPVALAFNRTATTSPISAADSAALWGVIRQMEADFGRALFRPVNLADLPAPDANAYSAKSVVVFVDNTLTGFAGYTNWFWEPSTLNMVAAKIRVTNPTLLANRSLMTHELLHALGFHHTCAWSTVMGGYGCPSSQGATKADVAAFHLGYAVRRTILTNAPTTTFADALRGEQLFDTSPVAARADAGLAVPFAARALRSFLFRGQPVTGDGAP